MKRFRTWAYKNGSKSSKDLGFLRIKKQNSRYRYRVGDVVINWGSQNCPFLCINSNEAVALSSNKLLSFRKWEGNNTITVPLFTDDRAVAEQWLEDGKKVVCRTLLRANSGRGIVLADNLDELVDAPLYTQYVPKRDEYRVHVFGGEVLDIQRKMRSREVADEDVNWQVRNHGNGFVFGREGVSLPDAATTTAINAVMELGLDFGAVDLIYNERQNVYYVLEVNTAPGLSGTTLEKYKEKFNEYHT